MSDIDQLNSIRSQTLARIAEIRAEPKPTYWIDGQRVHWQEYVESLEASLDWCDRKLAEYQPFEIRSRGTT